MRMSRRAGLFSLPEADDLKKFLKNMNVLVIWGRNSNQTGQLSQSVGSYAPASGVCYLFSVCNGYCSVFKVTNRTTVQRLNPSSNPGYGGYRYTGSGSSVTYGYANTDGASSYTSVYGATMMLVTFPNYTMAEADAWLQSFSGGITTGRNNSTTGNIRTTNKTRKFQLVAQDNLLDIVDGADYSLVKQCGASRASKINGSYLEAATTPSYSGTLYYIN